MFILEWYRNNDTIMDSQFAFNHEELNMLKRDMIHKAKKHDTILISRLNAEYNETIYISKLIKITK